MRGNQSLESAETREHRYFFNRRRWDKSRLKKDLEARTLSFEKKDEVTVNHVEGVGIVTRKDPATHTVYVSFNGKRALGYNAASVQHVEKAE